MTFPCKEEFVTFEKFAKRQKQIYPDACDFGVTLAELPSAELDELRINLNEMIQVFKKPEYDYAARNWHTGRDVSFFIPVEYDAGMEIGYAFRVAFIRDANVFGGGFICVDIQHCEQSKNPFK